MKLVSISMRNWKCFEKKKVVFEDDVTILNWKNGEGKTSLIQAIILCLFDKRPDGLSYDDLVDTKKRSRIELKFIHNTSTYIIEREIGKTTLFNVYKDENLISKNVKESKHILSNIISDSVLSSLWGYEPLALSNVLNSNYLFDILDNEFKEAQDIRQHFVSEKSYAQKHKSTLEKEITNQNVTEEQVDALKQEVKDIEEQIKNKAYIDDSKIAKAKRAESEYDEYIELKDKLSDITPDYTQDEVSRAERYGSTNREAQEFFNSKIKEYTETIQEEKTKVILPICKYPQNTVEKMIQESEENCTCVLCGKDKFKAPKLEYSNNNIGELENKLNKVKEIQDWYNFDSYKTSKEYWQNKRKFAPLEYLDNFDFKTILEEYNEDTNKLYEEYDEKRDKLEELNEDFTKITELLQAKEDWQDSKECVNIVDEYIKEAKEYYASQIVKIATELFNKISSRYKEITLENGVYKARLLSPDCDEELYLPVVSLSKGEKTIVAFCLILAIKQLFMPDIPLIMDESFANLDANNLDSIKQVIFNDNNTQWIIVSHDERMVS